jgi:hypothetical protein
VVFFAVGADGTTAATAYWFVVLTALWLGRSDATRWWSIRNARRRRAPWWSGTIFAVSAIAVAAVVSLAFHHGDPRGQVLFGGAVVAWWGGEGLDWLLDRQERHDAGSATTSA